MGKCSWKITKGNKKGDTCDIYSKKKYNEKYYCASHIKMIEILDKKNSEDSIEDVNSSPEVVIKKEHKKEPKKEVKKVFKVEPVKEVKKKKSKIIEITETPKEESDEDLSLDTHALDDVIESEYKKALKKDKSKSDIEKLRERVDYLFNKLNEIHPPKPMIDEIQFDNIDNVYQNDLPNIETFN